MMKRNMSYLIILSIIVLAFMTTGFTANGYTPVSEQVWASSVTAYPGQSGSYNISMQSAYGVFVDDEDKNYLVDYFNIEQKSYVSKGETGRHIDISSPVSGAYLMDNLAVIGMAEIQDSFALINHKPGLRADRNWWQVNWIDYFIKR